MSGSALEYLEKRTGVVDECVRAAANANLPGAKDGSVAVLAVGGYGRRELFPFSDIDLLLLVEGEEALSGLIDSVGEFTRALWDSGLKVSHSVRTITECCRLNEQNIELHISLLDVRRVWGDAGLFARLRTRLPIFYKRYAGKIAGRLAEMVRSRHAKFENTVYHLEPNVKEGPGGIRDVHFLHWACLLAPGREAVEQAAATVEGARELLYGVRYFLHSQMGRDSNVLSFDLQDEAAKLLPPVPLTPEEWMRIFYREARTVFQSTMLALEFLGVPDSTLIRHFLAIRQFLDRRGRLSTTEFTVSHNRVFLRNAPATLSSISAVFSLFVFVARQGVSLSWDAQQRVAQHSQAFAKVAVTRPVAWGAWQELLSQANVALALRDMHSSGFLTALVPQWSSIDSLVSRDFYHRYTVDEHTLVALETIDNLLAGKAAAARFHELAREEDNLAVLRMALLLHDLGKGTTPGDHVRGSLETANEGMAAMGVPVSDQEAIRFLISHHLELSRVVNVHDLDDPATARMLSSRMGTLENLRRLTLLTFADISAVNPTALNAWRMEQLWRVYLLGSNQLTRELATERIHDLDLSAASMSSEGPELAHFLEGFPTRYLRVHTPEQVQFHFCLEQQRLRDGAAVDVRREPGAYVMTVLAQDSPGLFALVCGALASFGMSIVQAEAATNTSGSGWSEFHFTDPTRTLELNPEEVQRMKSTVVKAIGGALNVRELLLKRRVPARPRSASELKPSVRFDGGASDHSTLIQFVGEDRPGLLFALASTLAEEGCDIELVLVDTEAHKAIDVFYVTKDKRKLDEPAQRELEEKLTAG